MTNEMKVIPCDFCSENLYENPIGYLLLSNVKYSGAEMYLLERDYHFCGLGCLYQFINASKAQPSVSGTSEPSLPQQG